MRFGAAIGACFMVCFERGMSQMLRLLGVGSRSFQPRVQHPSEIFIISWLTADPGCE
jgi:hypothetical protein